MGLYECAGPRVETVQAGFCSYPQVSMAVEEQGVDVVAAGVRAQRIAVMDEAFAETIEFIEPAATCADPEVSGRVFGHIPDHGVSGCVGVFGIVLEDCERVAVVFVKAVACSEPHKPAAILEHT